MFHKVEIRETLRKEENKINWFLKIPVIKSFFTKYNKNITRGTNWSAFTDSIALLHTL